MSVRKVTAEELLGAASLVMPVTAGLMQQTGGSKMSTVLETGRLKLRRWRSADEATFARECNVPEVTQWLGGCLPDERQKELFDWLQEQEAAYSHTFWPIEARGTGEFLGICGLVTVDEEDSTVLGATELGYRLKPEAQGKRYGTEAALACLRYAFEVEESWRVVSRTTVENAASWRIMKRIGMRHDTRLDYVSTDGTAFIVHVMTHSEWETTRATTRDGPTPSAG